MCIYVALESLNRNSRHTKQTLSPGRYKNVRRMSNESRPISGMAKNVKRRDTIRRLSIHVFSPSMHSPLFARYSLSHVTVISGSLFSPF